MDRLVSFFTFQWQRKLVALLLAFMLWFFIDKSIASTKMIPNVPIRVINIPSEKTILGILPNGILNKRINLTLSGTKNVIENLETGDLQVLIDAAQMNEEEWNLQISKKNLVSLNPSFNLSRHVTSINHPDYITRLSSLATAKVPVQVSTKGAPPEGYEYLDIWPKQFLHSIVGPEEEVQKIQENGLEMVVDMGLISKADLDKLKSSRENYHDDEVSFFIPNHWKKLMLPFRGSNGEALNDPEAQNLHIDFLRKEFFPIGKNIVLNVFYPLETIEEINPNSYPILKNEFIESKNGVHYLSSPLFIKDVSPTFLEIIRDNLEILIVAKTSKKDKTLNWSLEVVDPHELENRYVSYLIANHSFTKNDEPKHTAKREAHLRKRFREYLQKLALYHSPENPFELEIQIADEGIRAHPKNLKS